MNPQQHHKKLLFSLQPDNRFYFLNVWWKVTSKTNALLTAVLVGDDTATIEFTSDRLVYVPNVPEYAP